MLHLQRALAAVFAGVILAIGGVVSVTGTAHADPAIRTIIELGEDTFVENSTALPDGSWAISASDGLHHIYPDGSEGPMLLEAQSLGGVIIRGDKLIVAAGNNGGMGLDGVIWEINPNNPTDKRVLVSGISAPNGLIELPDGRIAYSTNLGPYAGIHAFSLEAPEHQEMINSDFILTPNGLSMGPDGFLYVCSTAGNEVAKVDLSTGRVVHVGKVVPLCDDLTVTADGAIYAASVLGIWDPVGSNLGSLFIPRRQMTKMPSLTAPPEEWLRQLIPQFTSIKPAGNDDWIVTSMKGGVYLARF